MSNLHTASPLEMMIKASQVDANRVDPSQALRAQILAENAEFDLENEGYREDTSKVAPWFLFPFLLLARLFPKKMASRIYYPALMDLISKYRESRGMPRGFARSKIALMATKDAISACHIVLTDHSVWTRRLPKSGSLSLASRSWTKRTIDFVGSLGLLLLFAPLLAVVATLIRLDSRGPILFRQRRTGLLGQPFTLLKFRTMVPDAERRLRDLEARNESAGGVLFKIKDDPRVTPLGRFLRRSSLDELPQLWNVLVGEMSLVGPRPLQLRDSERLEAMEPEGYTRRLSVIPGITGPWQVGGRSETSSDRMLRLDLDYIENWTIATDLELLAKTVVVVLSGRGAA